VFYVDPGQVNAQIPWDTPLGQATAVVTTGGVATAPRQFAVVAASPGIFTFGANRAVAQNQDYSLNTATAPAAVGSVVTVYLTGGGAVDNAIPTGVLSPAAPLARVNAAATATIGGQSAEILFLGMTPGLLGVVQANVRIPALSPGDYPVVITIGGAVSNAPLLTVSAN
jgi:uncharacterized protein (TIGR03437 family)